MNRLTQREDLSIGTDFQEYLRCDPRTRGDFLAASAPPDAGALFVGFGGAIHFTEIPRKRKGAALASSLADGLS